MSNSIPTFWLLDFDPQVDAARKARLNRPVERVRVLDVADAIGAFVTDNGRPFFCYNGVNSYAPLCPYLVGREKPGVRVMLRPLCPECKHEILRDGDVKHDGHEMRFGPSCDPTDPANEYCRCKCWEHVAEDDPIHNALRRFAKEEENVG